MAFCGYYLADRSKYINLCSHHVVQLIEDALLNRNQITLTDSGIDVVSKPDSNGIKIIVHLPKEDVIQHQRYSNGKWNDYPHCIPPTDVTLMVECTMQHANCQQEVYNLVLVYDGTQFVDYDMTYSDDVENIIDDINNNNARIRFKIWK